MGTVVDEGPEYPKLRGGPLLVAGAGLVVVTLLVTGSIPSILAVAAVVTFLLGSAVALGAFDGRACITPGLAPDQRTAALAERVLASLDRIEHRRVELGTPWPQLSVGPSGVRVIDVCGLEGPLMLDASGVVRRDDLRGCSRCSAAVDAGRVAANALAAANLALPIQVIAVVAPGTSIGAGDAGQPGFDPDPDLDLDLDLVLVAADRLADVFARGALLPMSVVDAAFLALNRAVMVVDGR